MSKATDVVISGCSAGGLATYLHVDLWHSLFPSSTKVVGMPDSGFFLGTFAIVSLVSPLCPWCRLCAPGVVCSCWIVPPLPLLLLTLGDIAACHLFTCLLMCSLGRSSPGYYACLSRRL